MLFTEPPPPETQTHPHDRQPQVVRNAGQCLGTRLYQRAQRTLHAVEGLGRTGHLARSAGIERRLIEIARQPVGGAGEHR